jgi:glutamine synthetase
MDRVFTPYKSEEWERYCATLTEWDLKTSIDGLP